MAELVRPQDLMFTSFEPKLKNRYVFSIGDIDAFLIKTANRPSLESEEVMLEHMNTTRYVKGKSRWQPLEITLYDPIIPSASQQVHEWIILHHESVTGADGYAEFYKKEVKINVLDPVGAIVEEWVLHGCYIQSANFGDLDFASSDPTEISLTLRYDYATLSF